MSSTSPSSIAAPNHNTFTVYALAFAAGALFIAARALAIIAFKSHADITTIIGHSYERPLILAPIITSFVSSWALWRIILHQHDYRAKAASGFVLFWTLGACLILTYFHEWWVHLSSLLALFVGFCVWDIYVCRCTSVDTNTKEEIWRGHKYINVPTILSVALIFFSLGVVSRSAAWDIFYTKVGSVGQPLIGFPGAIEAFTTGVVSFHLGVAALSYVMVTTSVYDGLWRGISSGK